MEKKCREDDNIDSLAPSTEDWDKDRSSADLHVEPNQLDGCAPIYLFVVAVLVFVVVIVVAPLYPPAPPSRPVSLISAGLERFAHGEGQS